MTTILAEVERSGLVEEQHGGAVAISDGAGRIVATLGDVDRTFFIRSAAKPFQALACLDAGLDLADLQLAIACASHSGDPVHVALVDATLVAAGLSEADLRCPPARPRPDADRRLAAAGDVAPSRRYHNCSGKHAAMLAACVTAGWDTHTYTDPGHPLQKRIREIVGDMTGIEPGPPGVDGCGAPVWRVTTVGLARAYSRLGSDDRLTRIREVMARYPMIVSGEGRADGLVGRWMGAPAKAGAAGCIGVAAAGHGVASKAWSGSGAVAGVGALEGLRWMGVMVPALADALDGVARPKVLGGGEVVGRYRFAGALESV